MSMVKPRGALLVLDVGKDSFGELALRLVRLGVDAVLAAGVEEAELMARQERIQMCAMLLPASASGELVDRALESVGSHTEVGPEAIAVVGPRPDEGALEALRQRGVGWRLWEPLEDRDLLFMAGALMWPGSDADLRLDVRIPTALPALVSQGRVSRSVLVGDLSPSGARVETDAPFAEGSEVELEIALPGGRVVTVGGVVRWAVEDDSDRARGPGFGVEFGDPSPEILVALADHIASERERFLL
jgi:hypothetical protein